MNILEELDEYTKEKIIEMQKCAIIAWKSRPSSGENFEYLNRKMIALPGIYPPSEISKPLVQNLGILSGDSVIDVGCGSGVIAAFSALAGAKRVLAVDINPLALVNTLANSEQHGISNIVETRESDLFSGIELNERFSLVAANLPFQNRSASDYSEAAIWDENLALNRRFFSEVRRFLLPGGRIRMAQANYGNTSEFIALARLNGFHVKKIGELRMKEPDKRVFYALDLEDLNQRCRYMY